MRLWKLLLAAGLVVATVPVSRPAAGAIPFTEEAFEASQGRASASSSRLPRAGARFASDSVGSSACSRKGHVKDLMVYTIDFDVRKDLVREMGAQEQSTLIVFKGVVEIGRSTGENDPAAIESLLAKSAE